MLSINLTTRWRINSWANKEGEEHEIWTVTALLIGLETVLISKVDSVIIIGASILAISLLRLVWIDMRASLRGGSVRSEASVEGYETS